MGFPDGSADKEFTCNEQDTQEMGFQSLGWNDPLEEEMATHSSMLVWEILWTEECSSLQSLGLQNWT